MQPTLTPPPWSGAAFAERGNGLEITCVTFVSVGSGGRLVSVGWAKYSNNRSSHEEIQAVIDTLDADVDRPCTLSLDAGSVNAPTRAHAETDLAPWPRATAPTGSASGPTC